MQPVILQQQTGANYGRQRQQLWESPGMWLGGVGILFMVALAVFQSKTQSSTKNVLGAAEFAKTHEKHAAKRLAYKQIEQGKHNEVALWINSPKKIKGRRVYQDKGTIYLPSQTRSTSVIGGSGSGKSYSVIKPTLRSAIAQGMPVILYDADYPGLAKTVAPLAASSGYDVQIFAPGYPESRVCNVLDFLESPEDASNASQLGKTLLKSMFVNKYCEN